MTYDVVEFWRELKAEHAPQVHPEDWLVLQKMKAAHSFAPSFEEFLNSHSFGDMGQNILDFSTIPLPYHGDVAHADILVLLLNPGLANTDHLDGDLGRMMRHRLRRNLVQDFSDTEFPFLWLDLALCWHEGFHWWEGKLRMVARQLAKQYFNGSYYEALKSLSKRVAGLDLFAYRSKKFASGTLLPRLPSVREIRAFARTDALKTADGRRRTVLVLRHSKMWDIAPSPDVILYSGGEARGASLGPDTQGGRAMLARYAAFPPSRS